MAFPNDQLFLDRFISFNKERYKTEPDFVAELDALTLGSIAFSNFRKEVQVNGDVHHLVDVRSPGLLRGKDQSYMPADYAIDGTAQLVDEIVRPKEELEEQLTEGVYFLGVSAEEHIGAILVYKGKKTVERIKDLVKSKCYFDLADNEITVSEDMTTIAIDSRTITGLLDVIESLYDDLPRYNGRYRYDGVITY